MILISLKISLLILKSKILMNKTKITLTLLFTLFIAFVNAQNNCKAWIIFNNKDSGNFNPYEYFHANTIYKRINSGISLSQFSDLPVNENYITQICKNVEKTKTISRWINGICVLADSLKLLSLQKQYPFIHSIYFVNKNQKNSICSAADKETPYSEKLRQLQMKLMHESYFDSMKLSGKDVIIAVFDGGFPDVNKHDAFNYMNKKKHILNTWNFVTKDENVYKSINHGTAVLSNIGGMVDKKKLGLAVDSKYLLAVTEEIAETFAEEENWLAAAEWADKNGADIINCSLGYTHSRYFQTQMNGSFSLVAKAANIAASKGILCFVSAGNEGNNSWKFIATPADADSVITVGGINPKTRLHYSFSSYGIAENKKVKPNIVAPGSTMVAKPKNKYGTMYGTSFSSPLAAGFAACMLESNPQLKGKPMQLKKLLEENSSLFPYYDLANGFGELMPVELKQKSIADKSNFEIIKNKEEIIITPKIAEYTNEYLYWKLLNENGEIIHYSIVKIENLNSISILKTNAKKIEVFYIGYYLEEDL
jgi:serine protease AprX